MRTSSICNNTLLAVMARSPHSTFCLRIKTTSSEAGPKASNIIMLHLIWYIIVGLIAGWAAKSVMHMHMTLLWTIVLGLVGSILGGFITHLFDRPKPEANYHPAGIIVSILCALLVLWLLSRIPIFPVD